MNSRIELEPRSTANPSGCEGGEPPRQNEPPCGRTASQFVFFSTSKKARSIGKGKWPKLAEVYHDKSGRKRYKGIPQALRRSQPEAQGSLGFKFNMAYILMLSCPHNFPIVFLHALREYPVGFGLRFAQTMKRFLKERSPLLSPHPVALQRIYTILF